MVIVMDMATGRVESALQATPTLRDAAACAGRANVWPVQHVAMPRLAERISEPDGNLLRRIDFAWSRLA